MTVAVELDPPANNADSSALRFLTEGAARLRAAGADYLTVADNPRAMARSDSVATAVLLSALTGVSVTPHLTARDRNELSLKSAIAAMDLAGLRETLVVTGDPLSVEYRSSIRNRQELNSVDLARRISAWNAEGRFLGAPITVSGALNVNARNFESELARAERKLEAGISRFYTQPVLSERAARNVERASELLDAELMAGILPIVSARNARFLAEGIHGIRLEGDIIARYEAADSEGVNFLATSLAIEYAARVRDHVDGFYVITPFKRVDVSAEVVRSIRLDDAKSLHLSPERGLVHA